MFVLAIISLAAAVGCLFFTIAAKPKNKMLKPIAVVGIVVFIALAVLFAFLHYVPKDEKADAGSYTDYGKKTVIYFE
ncbi:MAG: hypothetical protein IJ871_03470 [Ruminococcus sp.]|nr:hypothetical protein [Ruminococcus sp.]MBR2304184.1 hypothetical protein [Ruminococcus sp.]